MKPFKITHIGSVMIDAETHEVIFNTLLPKEVAEYVDHTHIKDSVLGNVQEIWNKSGEAGENLGSEGELDEYLLDEGECTQEEREIIVESLYSHAMKL
jgi:hypothetical protein